MASSSSTTLPNAPTLPPNTTSQTCTATRLTTHTTTPFNTVLSRFRSLVPSAPPTLSQQPDRPALESLITSTLQPDREFLLFAEFRHGAWIHHFPVANDELGPNGGRAVHRFVFGNPLFAIEVMREDVEAGLCVPVEALFVEEGGGGATCVWFLPSGLVAGHLDDQAVAGKGELVTAARRLDERVARLIEKVMA